MKIQWTRVLDQTDLQATVEVLFGDSTDAEQATIYALVRTTVDCGKLPIFEQLQKEALAPLRAAIAAEIQRLANQLDR